MATKVIRHDPQAAVQTAPETPSQQLVRKASEEFATDDSRGRRLTLRKPGIMAQYDLVAMVGPTRAQNQVWMAMVMPVLYVTMIDGVRVPTPTTYREVQALLERLDEDGIEAVSLAIQSHYGLGDPEAERDSLKNS